MPEDSYNRPPSSRPNGRGPAGLDHDWLGEDDPLAELARLVGHTDDNLAGRPSDPYGQPRHEPRFADIDPPEGWAPEPHPDHAHEPDLFAGEGDYDDYAASAQPAPLYDDEPKAQPEAYGEERKRSGLMTVTAVLGLVLAGAVAVAGYRYLGGSGDEGEPPTIKADARPAKEVPEGAETTAAANKQSYDRATQATDQARVVEPEEPAERPNQPRIIPTGQGGDATAQGATDANGVRRVRTFMVRPDGSVVDAASGTPAAATGGDQTAAAQPPAAPAEPAAPEAPQSMDQLAAAAAGQPIQGDSEGPSAGISFIPGEQFGIISEAPPAEAAPAAAQVPMPAPRPAGIVTASVSPPTAPAAPTDLMASTQRAATPAAARGGFVVQVASQRTEGDARGTYDALQRRFPQILGAYQPSIQSADLGERGTYYRVRVGPFASRDEATNLCMTLKTAGGDCVVQAN